MTATMAPAMQISNQARHLNVGLGAVGSVAIPATESDHGEIKLVPTLNGMHAIPFVHPVGKHQMVKIGWIRFGNRRLRTKIHWKAPIAIKYENAKIRVRHSKLREWPINFATKVSSDVSWLRCRYLPFIAAS